MDISRENIIVKCLEIGKGEDTSWVLQLGKHILLGTSFVFGSALALPANSALDPILRCCPHNVCKFMSQKSPCVMGPHNLWARSVMKVKPEVQRLKSLAFTYSR